MADPRSKPKTPKLKESKAPHQQIAKIASMKATEANTKPQMNKKSGRGR